MSNIYIYRSGPWQPLTRYFDPYYPPHGKWIKTALRRTFICHDCCDVRQARNLEISVDYDRRRIRCKNGNHPGWV